MNNKDAAEALMTDALSLGEKMLLRGAEVGRVEDTISRVLRSQGAERVDVLTITTSIVVTAHWAFGALTQTRRVKGSSYDMTALTRLNALSRDICSGKCPPEEISRRLSDISREPAYPFPVRVLLYGLVSCSFSLFFGGSLLDGAVSGAIGMVICLSLAGLKRLETPVLAATLLLSVLGGFLANGLVVLGLPIAPDKVSIGDIMLLVPGAVMTNSLRDLFTGDTISGLLRFTESLLLSLALAWGFALMSLLR